VLAAVILSGGGSQRMGSAKALLPYQGRPFLEHLLEVTVHAKIGTRRVVLGAQAELIRDAVRLAADEVVINAEWEKGQLSSIQAGIRSLPAWTDGMILCLIDHPLISASLVDELIGRFYAEQAARPPIVLPVYQGKRGHPVIFSAGAYTELLAAPLDQGARSVVWAHAGEVAEVITAEQGCVLNLNDPETVKRFLGGQASDSSSKFESK
jgi:molybdenum cofactor cytidylyltransferase